MVFKNEFQWITIHFGHDCSYAFYLKHEDTLCMLNLYKQKDDFCIHTWTSYGNDHEKTGTAAHVVNPDFIQMISIEDANPESADCASSIEAL